MERYLIPAREVRTEMRVLNSRFIATAAPVFSVEDAKEFVARIRREFADATHNVPAYVVGHGATVTAHCHDDGEPSGTAGRPALAVLQGSGLGDVAVVVTRYFGGTKLGTGGLVRAYGDAVRAVLAVLPRAEKVPTHTVLVAMPYSHYERVRKAVQAHEGQILDEEFAADLLERCDGQIERLTAAMVAQAASEGNQLAQDVFGHACQVYGWGIAQVITLLAPNVVVLGGGVALVGEALFLGPLRTAVDRYVFPPLQGSFEVVPAELGEEVVLHGALALAGETRT